MRLGIVGGALQGMECVLLAREAGYRSVVIDRRPDAPALSLCDEPLVMDPVADPEGAACLFDGFDYVIPACEDTRLLDALVSIMGDDPRLLFDPGAYSVSSSKLESNRLMSALDVPMPAEWPDCGYPFKGLCGAAVAYKLVEALYNVMQRDPEDVDYLMENVAIATVGDVMDLIGENRIFVKQGLEMLKRTQNPGLKALIECTGIDVDRLNAYHIGFVIGPCINASGRLDTAKRALELLNARTRRDAVMLAEDLKALNDSRKEMTERGVAEAVNLIETTSLKDDRVLVVYLPDCHESIAGIIAGRIRERYYRPVFVLTKAEDGVKGSGRSIEAYDMFAQMCRCRALFTKFGGHKLAAGLSLEEGNVQRFRETINTLCDLTEEDLQDTTDALRRYNRGIRLTGSGVVKPEDNRDESVVNEINGTETDCILSVLAPPYQEQFISRNRALLNAKVWLGCGALFREGSRAHRPSGRVRHFFRKFLFSWRAGKEQ